MITVDSLGFISCILKVRSSIPLKIFLLSLKTSSLSPWKHFYKLRALSLNELVHIILNKMGSSNAKIDNFLMWFGLCFLKPLFPLTFGLKHSLLLSILSTTFLLQNFRTSPLISISMAHFDHISIFILLVAYVLFILCCMKEINYLLNPSNVHS